MIKQPSLWYYHHHSSIVHSVKTVSILKGNLPVYLEVTSHPLLLEVAYSWYYMIIPSILNCQVYPPSVAFPLKLYNAVAVNVWFLLVCIGKSTLSVTFWIRVLRYLLFLLYGLSINRFRVCYVILTSHQSQMIMH